MKTAVKYSGPMTEASGYSQANRNIITSLCEVGVDVSTELQVYANHKTDYGPQGDLARSLQNKQNDYQIKVLHITPNVYAKHKEVGKYHVGHLFWETTGMSKEWAWYLREVDEIWTGSEYNKKCFEDSGFKGPIHVFPQPLDVERSEFPLPIQHAKGFVFYSIFQWIERKDPRSLLTAYWQEFQNGEDVTLVIKTYRLGFEDHEKSLLYKDIDTWKKELNLSSYPRVLIIDYLLSDKEKYQLHAAGDCFVSAHRGEGWGVVQAEALAAGNPVISTNLGGIHEWISDEGMLKVKYKWENVQGMDWAEQYTSEQKWGQVDIKDLRQKMRLVYENREVANEIARKGQKEAKEKLNFKAVGEVMKERIKQLYEEQSNG